MSEDTNPYYPASVAGGLLNITVTESEIENRFGNCKRLLANVTYQSYVGNDQCSGVNFNLW